MLTIKKREHLVLGVVAAASLLLTACGPPGLRALHKGDRLVQAGEYDKAIEALQSATNLLIQQPALVQARAYNLLGLAYHHTKTNTGLARQNYLQALALDRNLAAADFNLGCLEMEQGDLTAARDAITTFTSLRPRDWDGLTKLGWINYLLARKAPPSRDHDRERQADFDSAIKAYDKAQTVKPTAEVWNDLALIDLLRTSKPSPAAISAAVSKLKSAEATDPQYSPAILNLAVVYDPSGPYRFTNVNASLKVYGQYMALDPPPPYLKEVTVLSNNMDHASRFQIVEKSGNGSAPPADSGSSGNNISTPGLKIDWGKRGPIIPPSQPPRSAPATPVPTNPPPTASVPVPVPVPAPAIIHEEVLPVRVDTAPMQAVAETPPPASNSVAAPESSPDPPEKAVPDPNVPLSSTIVRPPSLLARVFGSRPKPTTDESEGAPRSPDHASAVTPLPAPAKIVHYLPPPANTDPGDRAEADRLVHVGAADEKGAHWKEARAHYEQAVKADPSDFDACEGLGVAAIKTEEFAAALESLHHALALNPDSANARYDYAWTLQKKNYPSDAAVELEKLLENHPRDVRAHLLLGTLYSQQLGQPDFARGHYKKVLELDPKNAEAPKIRLWLQNNPEL